MSPILFDERLGKVHDFGDLAEFSIGRSPSCQINILETQISRFQCTFAKTLSEDGETGWKIENKSTFKTTYVNSVQVSPVGMVLKNGDVVGVGPNQDHKYTFYLDSSDMPPSRKRSRLSKSSSLSPGRPNTEETTAARKRKISSAEVCRPKTAQEIPPLPSVGEVHEEPESASGPAAIGDNLGPVSFADIEPNPDFDSQPVDCDLDQVILPDVGEYSLEEFVQKCKVDAFACGSSKPQLGKSVDMLSRQLYKALLENQKSSESLNQLKKKFELTEEKKAEAVLLLQSANEETSKLDNDLVDALAEIDRLAQERSEYLEEVKTLTAAVQQQQSTSELETELVFKAIENEELANENTEIRASLADLQQKFDSAGSTKTDVIALIEQEFFCAVCNDSLYQPVTINCRHTFCLDCLTEWKKKKMECPSCRTRITTETSPLIIDNFIDRVAPVLGGDFVAKRREAIAERTAPPPTAAPPPPPARRGGRRVRRAAGRRRAMAQANDGGHGNFAGARAIVQYISDIIDLV